MCSVEFVAVGSGGGFGDDYHHHSCCENSDFGIVAGYNAELGVVAGCFDDCFGGLDGFDGFDGLDGCYDGFGGFRGFDVGFEYCEDYNYFVGTLVKS